MTNNNKGIVWHDKKTCSQTDCRCPGKDMTGTCFTLDLIKMTKTFLFLCVFCYVSLSPVRAAEQWKKEISDPKDSYKAMHLENVKSNGLTHVSDVSSWGDYKDKEHHHYRRRRAVVEFTPTEITQIVDEHNTFRRLEGSSDMEQMVCAHYFFKWIFFRLWK